MGRIEGTRRCVGVSAGSGELRVHVCKLGLDKLVVRDRVRELMACVGIGKGDVKRSLHQTSEDST